MAYRKTRVWNQTMPVSSSFSQINWGDPITKGLVGYWLLNDKKVAAGGIVRDMTKRTDGTFVGSVFPTNHRKFNDRIAAFGGSDCYVDLGNSTNSLNFGGTGGTGKFTLLAWVNCYSSPDGAGVIAEMYTPSNSTVMYEIGFDMDNGAVSGSKLAVGFYDSGYGWKIIKDSVNITTGIDYMIAGTYDGANLKLYKNGILINSSSPGVALPSTNYDKTVIGKRHDAAGLTSYFPGSVSNVRMYDRALNQTEIMRLYSEPFAGVVYPTIKMRSMAGVASASSKTFGYIIA